MTGEHSVNLNRILLAKALEKNSIQTLTPWELICEISLQTKTTEGGRGPICLDKSTVSSMIPDSRIWVIPSFCSRVTVSIDSSQRPS